MEDFKKRSNAWFWRDVSHRATTDGTKETHTNSCLSTTLIFVKNSYKLLSINFRTNSCLSTLTQTLICQRFYICFMTGKVCRNNSHTSSCLSILISVFVSSLARWVETTLTQTLVYQHLFNLLSLNSQSNSCLSTLTAKTDVLKKHI